MDKKDIYEHLARIYLDASKSSKNKRKKKKPDSHLFKNLFFISTLFIVTLSTGLFLSFKRHNLFSSSVTLTLLSDAIKINFHFDPAKKETYTLCLNKLDLTRFKELAFSAKKTDYKNKITLRVEFFNSFKEKSEIYFRDIPPKWQDYRVQLSGFRRISDWSQMSFLTFTVEEWNVQDKKGIVYIDNVILIR
jgi:hypothetical protein